MAEILRTKADVYKLSNEDLKKKMSTPTGVAEINAALQATDESPVVTPAEAAAKEAVDKAAKEAADRVAADAASAEAARVAAETEAAKKAAETTSKPWEAEDAGYAALGVHITRDSKGVIQHIVQEYQIKDEATGAPIGRPTRIAATSWAEFIAKKDECHAQATRAFNRLKSQKTSFKSQQQPAEPQYAQLTDDEMAQAIKDLKGDDAAKAVAAARKIAGSEVAKDRNAARDAEAKANGQRIGYEFMRRHANDFNPCKANSDLLGKFLDDNGLEFTVDNLELAFIAQEDKLAPVAVPARREEVPPVDNPPVVPTVPVPVIPVPVPQAVPAVPQHPAAELAARQAAASAPPAVPVPPATTPATENPVTVQPRPGVNGSIEPGTLSATRPGQQLSQELTKADILKMDKEKLKRMVKDPQSRARLNAILAQK